MSDKGQIRITDDGMDAALAKLDELEAAQAPDNATATATADPPPAEGDSVPTDETQQHAAADPESSEQTNNDDNPDTPAATDDSQEDDPLAALTDDTTETDESKTPETSSRYEKAQKRAAEEWKRINSDKETLARERAAFQRERDAFNRRLNPKPEDLEARAAQWQNQLDLLEAQAIKAERKAEESGSDADEQAATEARAKYQEERETRVGFIKASKAEAERLRNNPDPAHADADARFKKEQAQWWTKAAQEFPAVADKSSEVNKATRALMQSDPEFADHPKGLYIAARIAAAETAAARVSGLETELEAMKAKVTELEQLSAPGEGGNPVTNFGERSFNEKSDAEQEAELRQMARSLA